jgi:predicted nucleic acid-binding protein
MKRHCLLDSSFLIDLLDETGRGEHGPAIRWLRKNQDAELWVSVVTYAEVLEGAADSELVRALVGRLRWQGLHRIHAELAANLQRRAKQRMGENDAWQAAVALNMQGCIVGHDPKAFARLGNSYVDHRAP